MYQDKKDANHTIGMLYQGGLGLLDRDYYFDEDKADKRAEYVLYIQRVFALLGASGVADYSTEEAQKEAAKQVFQLESALADAHYTRTACRDPELTYNKKTLEEIKVMCADYAARRHKETQISASSGVTWADYLTKPPAPLAPAPSAEYFNSLFNWEEYFKLIGKEKDQLGDVNVATITGIEKAFELLCLSDSPDLQHYLVFHTALSFSDGHLPQAFKEAHFDFYEKTLKGTTEMKPRWKTVLAHMEVCILFFNSILPCACYVVL
jgi:predicted metalloendopeptidase